MITLTRLLQHLRQAPAGGRPHELARLPHPEQTLLAAWNDLWNALFQADLPPPLAQDLLQLYGSQPDRLAVALLAGWLLQAPGIAERLDAPGRSAQITQLLLTAQPAWLEEVSPLGLWQEAERQEEWARLWLRGLALQPDDETAESSERRWLRISSAHQAALFAALRLHRTRQAAIKTAQARLQQLENGD